MLISSLDKLECIDMFYYLVLVDQQKRRQELEAWAEFRELASVLMSRGASFKVKGKVYRAIRSVLG